MILDILLFLACFWVAPLIWAGRLLLPMALRDLWRAA